MNAKDVFICYSFKDLEQAQRVKTYLESAHLSCWMAPDSIPAGASVTTEIPKGIKESRTFVLLLSASSQSSDWSKNEVQFALQQNKAVIPFALDNSTLGEKFKDLSENSVINGIQLTEHSLKKLAATVRAVISKSDGDSVDPYAPQTNKLCVKRDIKDRIKRAKSTLLKAVVIFVLVVGGFVTILDKLPTWFPDHSKDLTGVTGECEWTYVTSSKHLIISGNGAIDDYNGTKADPAPWETFSSLIQKVTINEGVTHIGNYAFVGLTGTKEITIPKTVETIGDHAFYLTAVLGTISVSGDNPNFCGIDGNLYSKDKNILIKYASGNRKEKFKVPGSVTTVATDAFSCCNHIKNLDLNRVKRLSDDSINQCNNITSITLPSGLEETEGNPFRNNPSLAEIKVSGSNARFCAEDNVLYSKDMSTLVLYPQGKADPSFTLPDTVTMIGDWAFCKNKSLSKVSLPQALLTIGDHAFSDCESLKSVQLPEHLHSLGEGAFEYCLSLTDVHIPATVETIGDYPFAGCLKQRNINVSSDNYSYTSERGVLYNKSKSELIQYPSGKEALSFSMPEEVTAINTYAFAYVGLLTQISFNNKVTEIGDGAFKNCISLKSIVIPDTVTTFGKAVFMYCTHLTSVSLPKDLDRIPETTFYSCNELKTASLSSGIKEIGYEAYSGCTALHHIDLPDGLITIDACAFLNCPGLALISIPESVTSLGNYSLGYYLDDNGYMNRYSYLQITCTPGSAAELYANDNGFKLSGTTENSLQR